MRFLKSLTIGLLLGASATTVQAQDMHFTMFDMVPLELNPTYTGYYSGTFRIGGLYRSQWGGLSISPDGFGSVGGFSGYQTPSAYIDAPLAPFPKKGREGNVKSWMGAGLSVTMDKANGGLLDDSGISTLRASLSLAYHLGLGENGKTILSFGLKGGIMQFRTTADQYIYEDAIIANGGTTTPGFDRTLTSESLQNSSATAPDFTGGLMLSHRSRNIRFQLATSLNHFTSPKYNFLATEAKMPMTLLSNFIMEAELGQRFQLKPLIFFHNILTPSVGTDGGFSAYELNAQLLFGIHFNRAKDITLYLGGGYRVSDAAIARVGIDIKGFTFGFAYDINLGDGLSYNAFAKNNRGTAFELGVSYIARLYKVAVVEDVLFCPRF